MVSTAMPWGSTPPSASSTSVPPLVGTLRTVPSPLLVQYTKPAATATPTGLFCAVASSTGAQAEAAHTPPRQSWQHVPQCALSVARSTQAAPHITPPPSAQ